MKISVQSLDVIQLTCSALLPDIAVFVRPHRGAIAQATPKHRYLDTTDNRQR
jgi:hypothetical protein